MKQKPATPNPRKLLSEDQQTFTHQWWNGTFEKFPTQVGGSVKRDKCALCDCERQTFKSWRNGKWDYRVKYVRNGRKFQEVPDCWGSKNPS